MKRYSLEELNKEGTKDDYMVAMLVVTVLTMARCYEDTFSLRLSTIVGRISSDVSPFSHPPEEKVIQCLKMLEKRGFLEVLKPQSRWEKTAYRLKKKVRVSIDLIM